MDVVMILVKKYSTVSLLGFQQRWLSALDLHAEVPPQLLIVIIIPLFLKKTLLSHFKLTSFLTLSATLFCCITPYLKFPMFQTFPFMFASSEFTCCHTPIRNWSCLSVLQLSWCPLFNTAKCRVKAEKLVPVHFFRSLPSWSLSSCPVISAYWYLIFYSLCANQMVQKMTCDSVMMSWWFPALSSSHLVPYSLHSTVQFDLIPHHVSSGILAQWTESQLVV